MYHSIRARRRGEHRDQGFAPATSYRRTGSRCCGVPGWEGGTMEAWPIGGSRTPQSRQQGASTSCRTGCICRHARGHHHELAMQQTGLPFGHSVVPGEAQLTSTRRTPSFSDSVSSPTSPPTAREPFGACSSNRNKGQRKKSNGYYKTRFWMPSCICTKIHIHMCA